jgi:hypothetical protein
MKTVIEMAREIADPDKVDPWDEQSGLCVLTQVELERFAELVRADEREQGQKWFDAVTAQNKQAILAEREACAKVCEPQEEHDDPLTAWKIAATIRARGNT